MPWRRRSEGEWWLRHGDTTRNVEDQRADEGSTLWFTRELIALRHAVPELRLGPYASLDAGPGVWAWRRGDRVVATVNLSDRARVVRDVWGVVRLGTQRGRAGDEVAGRLRLEPWEGVIVVS